MFGSGSSSPGAYIHLSVVARRPEELLPEQHDGLVMATILAHFFLAKRKAVDLCLLSLAPPLYTRYSGFLRGFRVTFANENSSLRAR